MCTVRCYTEQALMQGNRGYCDSQTMRKIGIEPFHHWLALLRKRRFTDGIGKRGLGTFTTIGLQLLLVLHAVEGIYCSVYIYVVSLNL